LKQQENIKRKKINSSENFKGPKAIIKLFNNEETNFETVYALLGTGAEISLVDYEIALKHEWILFDTINACRSAAKAKIKIIGDTFVMIAPEEDVEATPLSLSVVKDLGKQIILGQDFLYAHNTWLIFEDTKINVRQKLLNGKSNNGVYKLRQAKENEINQILHKRCQKYKIPENKIIKSGKPA